MGSLIFGEVPSAAIDWVVAGFELGEALVVAAARPMLLTAREPLHDAVARASRPRWQQRHVLLHLQQLLRLRHRLLLLRLRPEVEVHAPPDPVPKQPLAPHSIDLARRNGHQKGDTNGPLGLLPERL